MKQIMGKLFLVCFGCFLSLLGAELSFRLFRPYHLDMQAKIWQPPLADSPLKNRFMMDDDYGFRPVLDNQVYSKYGTKVNSYDNEKKEGIKRVLFIGDSVTARGEIIEALKSEYGTALYEYWNAGVESFNIPQEVTYYEQFNYKINPDMVILTFHNNDFQTTPIAFRDQSGNVQLYSPQMARDDVIPWLLKHSDLYRRYIARTWNSEKKQESINREIKENLQKLRDRFKEENIEYAVILLPVIAPRNSWKDYEKKAYQDALSILNELGIQYYELLDALEHAEAEGITLSEPAGDRWHPSAEFATIIAEKLHLKGLISTR